MERITVSKIAKQIRGVSYKPENLHDTLDSNAVILLRANNIHDGKINFDDVMYIDRSKVSKEQYLQKGDILVCASSGSKQLVGKAASVDFDRECTFGAFCKVVRPIPEMADYLGAYFQSSIYRSKISEVAIGANINNIRNEHIDALDIPVRAPAENAKIVQIINLLQVVIDRRKIELQKLDELVKARFVELFGDPMDNPMRWDRVNISTVIGGKVSNGFFARRDDYCDDGNVKVLGVAHVVNRMYSNIEDLPTTNGSESDIAKYGVKYGDMLFCRSSLVAAGIGKASIVPQSTPNNVLFECHVIRLPLDLDKCVPEFMQVLSTTDYFRKQVISRSKTATMTTIGQDDILKTDIILPPLEVQKQFLHFVKQTDQLKVAIQKALNKTQTLFDSLMQEYFG